MLLMSTATGSRVAFHVYCHFLVAVEVAVEMAVDFQSGSRKKSGSRKVSYQRNDIILAYNDPLPDWVFTTEDSYLRHKERQSFISTFYIRTPGNDIKSQNY